MVDSRSIAQDTNDCQKGDLLDRFPSLSAQLLWKIGKASFQECGTLLARGCSHQNGLSVLFVACKRNLLECLFRKT